MQTTTLREGGGAFARVLALLAALILAATLVPAVAWADDGVIGYVEYTYDEDAGLESEAKTLSSSGYTVVSSDMSTAWGSDEGSWYVVSEDVSIADRITVSGTANLVLCDGATLTASAGITVISGNTLNIFAQEGGTGALVSGVSGSIYKCNAGIGSTDNKTCGTVSIHGGVVTATGGTDNNWYGSAGIGGGHGGSGGTVTIYNGTVEATGGECSSGIGGGYGGSGGTVTIYNGTVEATGGECSSGIGGGCYYYGGGAGGTVTIYGGTVEATGGQDATGIGAGYNSSDNGTLTIGTYVALVGGDSADEATELATGSTTYEGDRYLYMATSHAHFFIYSASGATVSASCSGEGCDLDGEEFAFSILAPSDLTYSGSGKAASLSGADDFNETTGQSVSESGIKYYDGDGDELDSTPTNAGDYLAELSLSGVATSESTSGTVTASLEFTISKAVPEVSAPTALALQYTGDEQELVTAGSTTAGTLQYALGEDGETAPEDGWGTDVPTGTDAGNYFVWYRVVGDDNYEDVEAACVTASITSSSGSNGSSTATTVQMWRLYNPASGEHFYTASTGERDLLVEAGWTYEGKAWVAPSTSSAPVYRLYNKNGGDHHYTTSAGERDLLVEVGWTYEGIGWYSDVSKRTPVYRQYNPNATTGAHNFTTSSGERDLLVEAGWNDEGVGWYAVA